MLNDLLLVSHRVGAEVAGQPIADWVRVHGKPVDTTWRRPGRRTAMALYALRPESGPASSLP